jgi:hypothetical protein
VSRVRLRHTVERGFCEHDQPYICSTSDDGGLLPSLFRGALGIEGVCSVGFWEGTLVLFLGRLYREWEENLEKTVSVVVVSLIRLHTCVGSVCGGDTSLMCHGRDV